MEHIKKTSTGKNNLPLMLVIILPEMRIIHPISCEEDSDGVSIYRDEPDYDDMTDYGYRSYRNSHPQNWTSPVA